MSGRLVGEVFACAPADLTPAERLVLLALGCLARDHDRTARKGSDAAHLADMTCLGVGTVRNALSSLAGRALIQPMHKARRGLAQDYRLTPLGVHHRATKRHPSMTLEDELASLPDDATTPESVTP